MTEVSNADVFAWLDKMFVPPLKQFLHTHVSEAVQQAEQPLRARIRELEAELARIRAAGACLNATPGLR
jgi:hypothetical protein